MSEAYEATPTRFDLSPEDRYRVSRLYEEIRGRLEELAMIGARAAGFTLTSDMVRKFDPQPSTLRRRPPTSRLCARERGSGRVPASSS